MKMLENLSSDLEKSMEGPGSGPSPLDLETFLPWACIQLQCPEIVTVNKKFEDEYISIVRYDLKKSLHKVKHQSVVPADAHVSDHVSEQRVRSPSVALSDAEQVKVVVVYTNETCTEIKFLKNRRIPRILLQIIGLIIKFHAQVHTITINAGMDKYTIHELNKILPMSNITDLCLDGTSLCDNSYHLLLDNPVRLKHLSLARCRINDKSVASIASKLMHPLPASKVLAVLNLSTNRITDVGAKSLADVLRTNDTLHYLNLSSNWLTDVGAFALLNMLMEFMVTDEELKISKQRYLKYLKEKYSLVNKLLIELKEVEMEKKRKGKKSIVPTKKTRLEKETSLKSFDIIISPEMATYLRQTAEHMAVDICGPFLDPFNKERTFLKNNIVYCKGNNTLNYLNLSYNSLSYVTAKKLLTVIEYQDAMLRKPKGLISVSIDGNFMPTACSEYEKIDELLIAGLLSERKSYNKSNKKNPINKPLKANK